MVQSSGTVIWTEFRFKPGRCAVICFIMDKQESMPNVMEGMVIVYNVGD